MLGEEIPSPRQGYRCGLVAGEEECHHLVTHLTVGHPASVVGILCLEEDGEEVTTVLGASAPIGDHAVDDVVETTDRLAQPQVRRGRQPQRKKLRQQAPEALAK